MAFKMDRARKGIPLAISLVAAGHALRVHTLRKQVLEYNALYVRIPFHLELHSRQAATRSYTQSSFRRPKLSSRYAKPLIETRIGQ